MVHESDWSRIANYVTGACSDEEKCALEARLLADHELREIVDEAFRIWKGAELGPDAEPAVAQWDLESTWREFVRKGAARPPLVVETNAARPRPARYPAGHNPRRRTVTSARPWMAAAAALAITVGATFWIRMKVNMSGVPRSVADASMYTVTAKPGQRLNFQMPDGSHVVLAAASTLRYPKTYGRVRRDVYLDGRAYFEVTHNAAKPFAVHTRRAIASDLGTRFDVRAYSDDDVVEVAVADGAVELASRDRDTGATAKGVVLGAGQLGRIDPNGAVAVRAGVDIRQRLAWTEGRLVFENAALRDVLLELTHWYDIDFVMADPVLGERRFTGTFYKEPVEEVLQFLTLSTGASYRRDGRTITLISNHLREQ